MLGVLWAGGFHGVYRPAMAPQAGWRRLSSCAIDAALGEVCQGACAYGWLVVGLDPSLVELRGMDL